MSSDLLAEAQANTVALSAVVRALSNGVDLGGGR